MNNKFCKTLSSVFAGAICCTMMIPSMAVSADTKIEINEKNFPDKYFRQTLKKDMYDKNEDGYLSSDEIEELCDYRCAECGVKDLTGIEYLTNLECLVAYGNELAKIDLSKNKKLSELWVENNKLEELDLSNNTELNFLRCGGNLFDSIDLSKNTKLQTLVITKSNLKTLDLSNQKEMQILYVDDNDLSTLDLSNISDLYALNINGNNITSLDLSKFKSIRELDCSNNKLESLNVTGCEGIMTLKCTRNKLTALDVSSCTDILELRCQGNSIASLDIGKCKHLIDAYNGNKNEKNGCIYYTTDKDDDIMLSIDKDTVVEGPSQDIDNTVKNLDMDCGSTLALKIKDAKNVNIKISDDSVIKIVNGKSIKALKAGVARVKVTSSDNEYEIKVRVLYKDVKDSSKFWFEPTYALTEKGVVKGYDNQTKFKSANKCTRAQMVTFLWRLAGSPEPETKECKFSDVKKSDYFYKACLWGNEKGIVEGYKDGTFGPQIVCARRHAVTFLWRLAGKPEPAGDKTKFTDVFKDIDEDDYFFKATIWATEQKIVAGYEDNTFRPDGDCLRRQMVTFLYKYDKFVNNK